MRGVGNKPHSFVADDKGCGAYQARPLREAREEWQLLVIHYHPGGDPDDAKSAKPIL